MGDYALYLGIEFNDVDSLASVFFLDIAAHAQVVVFLSNVCILHKSSEMLLLFAGKHRFFDALDVIFREFVLVAFVHKLVACVNKQHAVVAFRLFEYYDACCDRDTKEQIIWKLNNSVNLVVLNQVFANLALGTASIQYSRELDDGSCTCGR